MRTRWLKKQQDDERNDASNVDATVNAVLVDLAREKFNEAIAAERMVDVVILGLTYRCWRCGWVSTPIVGMMEPGGDFDSEEFVTCDDDELLGLAWQYLPVEARKRFMVGEVRQRYSKTIRAEYLSNGCSACSALFGEFPLFHEELPEALSTEGADALTELAVVSMPSSVWTDAYESRWAYEPEEDKDSPEDEE